MKLSTFHGGIKESPADTIIVNLFEGVKELAGATGAVDQTLEGAISEQIKNGDLIGKLGEVAVVHPRGTIQAKRVLVAGLGKSEDFNINSVRLAAAAAIKKARALNGNIVATIVHGAGIGGLPVSDAAQATVESSALALYRFDADKKKNTDENQINSLIIVERSEEKLDDIETGLLAAEAISSGVSLARDLVNMPPNVATPTKMAAAAEEIAKDYGMKVTIGGRRWAKRRDMGAFLAVAQGAGEKPKFIVLEHNGHRDDLDTVVLVGKGITFDTGGISLKPVQRMGLMKTDMGGAAAVLGAMRAIGALDLPLRIIGITPCTENMPDAFAYRPADVIKASNGKTIEIISTDAEGRMVLADGLVYAEKFNPNAVVDLATLTGACVVALGKGMAAGLFSTDDQLQKQIEEAGKTTHERVWSLPLWDDYRDMIKSDVADMKNSGGRMGGVASSAIFLKEFTNYPWAHLDIAGMAYGEKEHGFIPAGATGYGVRLLVQFLRHWQS